MEEGGPILIQISVVGGEHEKKRVMGAKFDIGP